MKIGVIFVHSAKEYLMQIKLCEIHINNKLEDLDKLKSMIFKITTTLKQDVVSSSGNQDKLGDAIAKIVDLETEINQAIDDFIDKKREISSIIDKVKNAEQLQVLHKRYLEHKRWEEIACEMNMTFRNVCYIHGRALETVERIMKGE